MHLEGRIRPRSLLAATLVMLALGGSPARAEVTLPGGTVIQKVDFERHVMGLFGRMGCNLGSCHGSFQGKGGLQLSLFGYDPEMDYQALTRQVQGRRISLTDPDLSLLLLKATGQVAHEGKVRFGKNSWAYQLLREWIAQGAKWERGSGEAKSVRVVPGEYAFLKPGLTGQLRVEAEFADGTREDITSLCDFRTNDEAVAEVGSLGQVRGVRPGDTAVIVIYRGHVVPVRVLVPTEVKPGFSYPDLEPTNAIDREVQAKLRRLNMVPSELASDSEFLRRVYLDTIGTLPTPAEVKAFLGDSRPDKRARKIDELLDHPLHAALWATKFCDITGNNTDALENPQQRKARLSQMWHDWFRKRLAANVPYDQIVKGVLTATSREGRKAEDYIKEVEAIDEAQDKLEPTKYADRATLDLFWRTQARVPLEVWGEKTAAAFLGVRLECAQCHKHPFDRWTQVDYRSFANVFASVSVGVSPESTKLFRDANVERNKKSQERTAAMRAKMPVPAAPLAPLREVFVAPGGRGGYQPFTHPNAKNILAPRSLGGPELKVAAGDDPRSALFEWMRAPENPFFARSFANRVWGHYFGVGIVHPVDDFSLANPASNEKLLDVLAQEFLRSKYDIKALERAVLNSRTYQTAAKPNDTNRFDRINYARSYVRPLMAEVVVDLLNGALGQTEKWAPTDGVPATARAIEVGASRVQNPTVAYAFRVFGRPARTTACDCERSMEPGLTQKLFLMADPNLMTKVRAADNRLQKLLAEHKDDDKALDELFLATLTRLPTEAERGKFREHREARKGAVRREVFVDTLWALINTTEFIFNH